MALRSCSIPSALMFLKNISFTMLFFIGTNLWGQRQELFLLQDKIDRLVDMSGKIFFTAPKEYRLVDEDLIYGRQGITQLLYSFTKFPILACHRDRREYVLLNKDGEVEAYFPPTMKAVSNPTQGFYIASYEIEHKLYTETMLSFLDAKMQQYFEPFHAADKFSERLAAVKFGKGWRYINKEGQEFDLIPDSLKYAEWVTSFYDGLSKVTLSVKNSFIKPYFINKKGKVILDIPKIVGGKNINKISDFMGGVAIIETQWPQTNGYKGYPIKVINIKGKIVLECEHTIDCKVSSNGFITLFSRDSENKDMVSLYTAKGNKIKLPDSTSYIKHIEGSYFDIALGKGDKRVFARFDVSTGKVFELFPTYGCLGIHKSNAVFRGVNNDVYVFNMKTKDTIYKSDAKEMTVYDLDKYHGKMGDIETFYCSKDEWTSRLSEMTNLKFLSLSNLTVDTFPNLPNPQILQLLRIRNCRKIKRIQPEINNLTQLSLSGATSFENLGAYLSHQKSLQKLFIVNMDLTSADMSVIRYRYPTAVISGDAKAADYSVQEVIKGF